MNSSDSIVRPLLPSKKTYAAPQIDELGKLIEVTQGGTGDHTEGGTSYYAYWCAPCTCSCTGS